MTDTIVQDDAASAERRAGFIAAAAAYTLWGFLPLFMKLLSFADAREVLAERIIWCVPTAVLVVIGMSGWRRGLADTRAAFRPRMLLALTASAIFICLNWGLYLIMVLYDRVIESALAYFLVPLVAIAIGAIFFRERLTFAQMAALGFAAAGVITQGFALGAAPWMALALCGSWCVYMVIRKQAPVPAATGLLVETLILLPVAVGLLMWTEQTARLTFDDGWTHAILLALAGPVTAAPLVLFALGARRISFTTIGLLQFVAPSLQFATGVALGEPVSPLRAFSFALIWLALIIFAWNAVRRARLTPKPA